MPENVKQDPNAPPADEQTPTEQLSSQQDTSTEPAPEHRYGEDAGYLAGKTEKEAIAWVNNLVSEVQQAFAQRQQPAPSPQQTQVQMQNSGLPDPDMALTDPKGYQESLARYFTAQQDARLQQAAAPVFNQMAGLQRQASRTDPQNTEVWNRWASEVDTIVSALPPQLRTKEAYDGAVGIVRGRHVKELVAEGIEKASTAGTGLARASSDAGASVEASGSNDLWDKIAETAIGKRTLDTIGKRGIIEGIRKGAYKSLEEYAEYVSKSKVRVTDNKGKQVIQNV